MNREFTAYGVDGCKTGWFWIALTPSNKVAWGIEETIASLVARAAESDRIFIDIPIGLPNGPGERLCDKEAREKLGQPRGSSVFPAPARPVLQAKDYPQANRISENTIGKGISQQAFAITPKIREVDELLPSSSKARRIVREVHPEICFWALAGCQPMRHSKKKREGEAERLAALKELCPKIGETYGRVIEQYTGSEVARDDILDAAVAAIMASAGASALKTLPEHPKRDELGLPMEMVYVLREDIPRCS